MSSIRRIAVLLVGLAAVAQPAAAFHDNTLPVRYSAAIGTQGWVTLSLTVPEGLGYDNPLLDIEVEGRGTDVSAVGGGEWALDAQGSPTWASAFTGWSSGEVYVRGPEPVGVVVDTRSHVNEDSFGFASTYYGLDAGTYTLVVGYVTDAATGSGTLTISSADTIGVSVTGSGSKGFMFMERHFDPCTRAAGFLAGAAAGCEASVEIGDRLFGIFSSHGVSVVRHEGPNGTTIGDDFMFGAPAGTHRFVVDAEAGVVFEGFYVWGIDVSGLTVRS